MGKLEFYLNGMVTLGGSAILFLSFMLFSTPYVLYLIFIQLMCFGCVVFGYLIFRNLEDEIEKNNAESEKQG